VQLWLFIIHKQDCDCSHALCVDARWVYLQFRDLDLCTSGTICTVGRARDASGAGSPHTATLCSGLGRTEERGTSVKNKPRDCEKQPPFSFPVLFPEAYLKKGP